MKPRCGAAYGSQRLFVELEGQVGVKAADDMDFGSPFPLRFTSASANFIQRQGVGALFAGRARKGAEGAAVDADVGRVDMAVNVEIDVAAVFASVDQRCQFTDGEQVV